MYLSIFEILLKICLVFLTKICTTSYCYLIDGFLESDYLPAEGIQSQRCVNSLTHELITRPSHPPKSASLCMGRAMRVVVVGGRRVGKTAILRQVACFEDITSKKYEPTIDDTYQVILEEADRPREILIFHDTGGVPDNGPAELKKPYLQVADAFVLVYSVADHESFNKVDLLKRSIERHFGKDRKEVPIVALGNMRDLASRKVDSDLAYNWAARERVKLFEVSAKDRNTLVEFVQYLGQRHFHPIKESKFSLSKKLKSEKVNPSILMDF
ncbi:GTP-binding domain protein [Dictyocaulus viviparus]|uniref:GTP-binding domain protein n=1 Tax=Dictyocaulus viviparus TaxID=29172 RepID=A0A0D8XRJ9_DICVI|nr:GTP-binding domain protein [Dictyocaulus viviparus]